MLPRVAPTTGVSQPSLAVPASTSVDVTTRAQPTAAALANLRAEVLLRLIETMLKHMPRTAEPNAGRDLLETLLSALKTAPGRDGENGRKLADLLARLPTELRPSVEKLINTVLSSMPTRSLVEIVRNPNGPEAQKLATLITASLNAEAASSTAGERQQKPLGLTTQQLVAVGRQGLLQQTAHVPGDARVLQTTLKRVFDIDTGKPRMLAGQTAPAETGRQAPAGATRLPVDPGNAARTEARLPPPAVSLGAEKPVETVKAAVRHMGNAEETQATTPGARGEEPAGRTQLAVGQVLARSVLQAVARDVPPALLMQAVVQLMETLSPEEANFLRALLERPLDPATEQDPALAAADLPEDAAENTATVARSKPETVQQQAMPPQVANDDEKPLPLPTTGRETAQAAVADASPERLLTSAALLREGVPLAFVPYLPAEEETGWPEEQEADKEEAAEEEDTQGNDGAEGDAEQDASAETAADEPESPDMARRREKTADMVGVIEPGLAFYQKLGDYWT